MTSIEKIKTIGDRIKFIRKDVIKISRKEFSQKHAISSGSLQGFEVNKSKKIRENTINNLLLAFKSEGVLVDKKWLLEGIGDPPEKAISQIAPKSHYPVGIKLSEEERRVLIAETNKNNTTYKLNYELLSNCKEGKFGKIATLINMGADIHLMNANRLRFYDDHENTPLHWASKFGAMECLDLLIKSGSAINARNRKNETPLHWACAKEALDVIKYLIENGAAINATDADGGTPFSWACYIGNLDIVKFFYKKNADIHLDDIENNSPLLWACYRGNFEVIKFLLSIGADEKAVNKSGLSAIDLASQNGHCEIVEFFVENF